MKTKIYILLALIGCFFSACSDFLEEKPTTQIHKDGVYGSPTTALAVLSGCYARMAGEEAYGYRYQHVLLTTSGMGVSLRSNDVNMTGMNIMANEENVEKMYIAQYDIIGVANDILDGMKKSQIDEEVRNRIIGEASFIRAVSYFNLVRLLGRIPLLTEPVVGFEAAQQPREEVNKVYELIITDLQTAFEKLPLPNKETITGRPHRFAAQALLAKVYLTLAGNDENSEYWQKCYDAAKLVYDEQCYKLVPFNALFGGSNKNNAESIFEIQFSAAQGGTKITTTTIPSGHPIMPLATEGKQSGKTRPTKLAFDMFDASDPRRDVTFAHTSYKNMFETEAKKQNLILYPTPKGTKGLYYKKGDSEYAAWLKYADPSYVTASSCNFVYYRYGDLLLILAEAANELGAKDESAGYLNEVLDRARDANGNGVIDAETEIQPLPVIAGEHTRESLRDFIIDERLRELNGECDEWYTIRRRGTEKLKEIIMAHNELIYGLFGEDKSKYPDNVYDWPSDDESVKRNMLMPFPLDEINRNEQIPQDDQNYGY